MSMDDIYKFDNLEDAFVAIDNNELTEDAPFNVNNTSCYYIGKREKLLDGISMLVYKFTLIYAFQAEVEIATTGKRGGDAGHGGRTYISIKSSEETDAFSPVKISVEGDMELSAIVDSMSLFLALLGHVESNKKTLPWCELPYNC